MKYDKEWFRTVNDTIRKINREFKPAPGDPLGDVKKRIDELVRKLKGSAKKSVMLIRARRGAQPEPLL